MVLKEVLCFFGLTVGLAVMLVLLLERRRPNDLSQGECVTAHRVKLTLDNCIRQEWSPNSHTIHANTSCET